MIHISHFTSWPWSTTNKIVATDQTMLIKVMKKIYYNNNNKYKIDNRKGTYGNIFISFYKYLKSLLCPTRQVMKEEIGT